MTTDDTTTTARKGKQPAFIAYSVSEEPGRKANFRDIGAVFPNRDGKGFTILLGALPVGTRVVLLPYEPRADEAGPDAG